MDSDGKPVSVDQHWKQFMEKSGKKKTVKRTHEEGMKKKKPEVEKKSDYVFGDDDDDGVGQGDQVKRMKKIPLKKKK